MAESGEDERASSAEDQDAQLLQSQVDNSTHSLVIRHMSCSAYHQLFFTTEISEFTLWR